MRVNPVASALSKRCAGLALALSLLSISCSMATQSDPERGAQGDRSLLEKGRAAEASISGGETGTHRIRIAADQYARLTIEHGQLEIMVRASDAEGKLELEQKSQPGIERTVIELAPGRDVTLDLHVEPLFATAPAAAYRVELRSLRRATAAQLQMHEARRHSTLTLLAVRNDDYAGALQHAEKALALTESELPQDHPEVGVRAKELGVILSAQAEYGKADVLLRRAMAIGGNAAQPDQLAISEAANQLAKNASELGQFDEAERLAEDSLRMRRELLGEEHFLVAVSLMTLAHIHVTTRDLAAASDLSDRALSVVAKSYPPDTLEYQEFAVQAARVRTVRGEFDSARELLDNAWTVRQKLAGSQGLHAADSLTGLGSFHTERRENLKAEEVSLRALQLKEKILGADHPQIAMLLNNLGLVAYRKRDYASATAYYQRALSIIEARFGAGHFSTVAPLNNLGLIVWRNEDHRAAEKYFQRALDVMDATVGPDNPRSAPILGNLGIIAKETGDYPRAESYYKRTIAIHESSLGPHHPELVVPVESLGILYRDQGDYAESEPYFLRALEITTAALGPEHPDVARHLKNLAHLYSADGDRGRALEAFQRLVAIDEKDLPLRLALGSERQKLAFFRPYPITLEKIISFHAASPDDGEARDLAATILLQRKGRVLDALIDTHAAVRDRSAPALRTQFDELNAVVSKLATLVLSGPQGVSMDVHLAEIDSLYSQKDAIERALNRSTAGEFETPSTVTLKAVKDSIPSDSILIELAIYRPYDPKTAIESTESFGEPRYVAYIISGQSEVEWTELGPVKAIDEAIQELRRALRNPETGGLRASARAVDEMVMRPIRKFAGSTPRFLIAPDGQLALIPFEALIDEKGRYLIERYGFSYLGSGRDLLRMHEKRPAGSRPLIVADPFFGEPAVAAGRPVQSEKTTALRGIFIGEDSANVYFAPLSGTEHEARAIQSHFPEAEVLTRSEASEESLRTVHAPGILHIATHGFFLDGPGEDSEIDGIVQDSRGIQATARIENPLLRSGLALAGANLSGDGGDDGILTALEASALNLWGTKLVTLSACDTGVGEVRNGDGVYGLRRAFFIAGTETLVMSLWPVSDYVTRQMMTAYYAGLKRGHGRGDALRQAQLTMLRRTDRRHPFYWASFIQSGEWANLEGQR